MPHATVVIFKQLLIQKQFYYHKIYLTTKEWHNQLQRIQKLFQKFMGTHIGPLQ